MELMLMWMLILDLKKLLRNLLKKKTIIVLWTALGNYLGFIIISVLVYGTKMSVLFLL